MSYLKRLFNLVFSRRALTLAAVLVVAVAVWFIGPLVSIDDYHPLDSVSSKVIVIALLLALLLLWLLGWSFGIVWVGVLCVVIWSLGPLLAVGDTRPLTPPWSRVLLISVLLGFYAMYGLYCLWTAMRSNDVLLQRVLNPFARKSHPELVGRDEIRVVNSVVSKAIEKMRRMRTSSSGLRRLLDHSRYLYELPWYMAIGSPGAGKTTLILNSGLDFPDADQMRVSSMKSRVETGNCDWWFTNEAILIDTAGRYTLQETDPLHGEDSERAGNTAQVNAAEWHGFLAALRKCRPRAPINGVLLAVSVKELLTLSSAGRITLAAQMRARLGELRQQLGIRFPVYLLLTKLDLLPGFAEYFQSLTAEGRAQILGFTLPYQYDVEPDGPEDLRVQCTAEMRLLERRLAGGIDIRLQEEYEVDRRRKLYGLPAEFRCLSGRVVELIGMVFLDSRYDDTELNSALRGVYFTSAAQTQDLIPADRTTLLQRLRTGFGSLAGKSDPIVSTDNTPTGYRGYFLRNLFQRVILAEGHLVRPNLRWEIRFRALRLVGHLLSLALGGWLISGLIASFDNNRDYLAAIGNKTDALASQVRSFRNSAQAGALAPVLSTSRDLARLQNVDLDSPGIDYRYGLATIPGVVDAANVTYARLQSQMLLPRIASRLEAVLNKQLDKQDADGVYATLSVYLMLFDPKHYDAKAIRTWVLNDWEHTDSSASMGDRNLMAAHLDALFVDGEPAIPPTPQNAELERAARDFLGRNPVSGRLYERAIAQMQKSAPENMTLIRAAGPQGGAVFALVAATELERGIPGLYTYDGYHEVFNKRLPEFLAHAQAQDAWVMGRADATARQTGFAGIGAPHADNTRLTNEIRRQYLTDYGNYWSQFLEDVRASASGDSDSLELDLQTLRTLSAPDSPLARLARTAVHETSLSVADGDDGSSVANSATTMRGQYGSAARAVSALAEGATATIAQLSQQKMERELVDDRFGALREVVTGHAGSGGAAGQQSPGGALPLDAIMGLINQQYARLVVAGNVLASNSMPQVDDVSTSLQLEADKLPTPLRAVLTGIATRSMQKVDQSVGALLSAQVDSSVGNACRRAIEGKYPFVASQQEVDIDDFNRVFAANGLLDDFFQKTLAPHVDTSMRPWRYRPVAPGMPPVRGPMLEPFERAATIREAFFRDPGATRMAWKGTLKVASLDPEITELSIDIDGQGMRYAHGPVTPFAVSWPGPRGGSMAGLTASPRVSPDTSTMIAQGPWALFRLADRGRITQTSSASRSAVDFNFDDRHAVLEIVSGGESIARLGSLLKGFRCPGSIALTAGRFARNEVLNAY